MIDNAFLSDQILAEAWRYIVADDEIAGLAMNVSIEAAGGRLGPRAEPNVANMSGASPAWREMKKQVYILLCTENPRYAEVRSKAAATGAASKNFGLPTIASYVSVHVGLPEALILPFVALTLVASAQIGLGTWCAAQIALNPDFGDTVLLPPPKGEAGQESKHGGQVKELQAGDRLVDGRLDPDAQSPHNERAKPFDPNENNPT